MTGQENQESRPKAIGVPFGCKVLGWIYIVDALSVMFENGNEPAGIVNIFKTAVCFIMITSATAMLLGRKIGLAAFSMFLAIGGLSFFSYYYVGRAAMSFKAVAITLLYYFIPTIYLLSKWNVFSLINASELDQNGGGNAYSKSGTLSLKPAVRFNDAATRDNVIQFIKRVFNAINKSVRRL